MTYLIKAPPTSMKWAYMIGTGNYLYSGAEAKITLPTLVKETGMLCSLSSNDITLADKDYIFFIRPFHDKSADNDYGNTQFYLKVNGVRLTAGETLISSGTGSQSSLRSQVSFSPFYHKGTAGEVVNLFLSCTESQQQHAIYLQNGAVGVQQLGLFIWEIDR